MFCESQVLGLQAACGGYGENMGCFRTRRDVETRKSFKPIPRILIKIYDRASVGGLVNPLNDDSVSPSPSFPPPTLTEKTVSHHRPRRTIAVRPESAPRLHGNGGRHHDGTRPPRRSLLQHQARIAVAEHHQRRRG